MMQKEQLDVQKEQLAAQKEAQKDLATVTVKCIEVSDWGPWVWLKTFLAQLLPCVCFVGKEVRSGRQDCRGSCGEGQ